MSVPIRRHARGAAVMAAVAAIALSACGRTDAGDAEASGDQDVRVVEHAMGEARISGTPERVVVLDTGELDTTLALGVTPVGAVRTDVGEALPEYVAAAGVDPDDIAEVGTISTPDLESILALEPDLILTNTVRHEALYGQLNEIAPTVMAPDIGKAWKDSMRLNAEALGLADEGEQVLAEYEDRAAAVGTRFGDPAELEVTATRFMTGAEVRLYGRYSFIGTVLEDAGFAFPPALDDAERVEVGPERIDDADTDLVFFAGYGTDGRTGLQEVTSTPLWQQLSAVQDGRAHAVDDDRWFLAIGPLGANLVLDDLEEIAAAS